MLPREAKEERVSSKYAAVDGIVSRYAAGNGAPGIGYGVVRDGELVHAGGTGVSRLGGAAPDAETVFRIASMSKSFTASAVLLLRDSGALALDDPAAAYVPELASWPLVTPDAAPVTIRHLLTMTAGFPTDDPWGDRQQGLPVAEFGRLLAGGVSVNWAPGTMFEYSNMGYAILGLVISAVSGMPYPSFVRAALLEPLGMTRTGFEAAEFGPAADGPAPAGLAQGGLAPGGLAQGGLAPGGLAQGYRQAADGWEQVPFDPCGAFAPMGGVFSCVRDLATWVAGFASAFPPGAAGPAGGRHPLPAASRREMQLAQVMIGGRQGRALPGGQAGWPGAYGFGLFVDEDPALGRVVSHSGGYPGFGSNMRWHPATGAGVIALGNGTYAPMGTLAALMLGELVPARPAVYRVALSPAAPGGPWPQTLAAREEVSGLLSAVASLAPGDPEAADALLAAGPFAPNVALDRPHAERRAEIEQLATRIGSFADAPDRGFEHDTPAHCRWFLAGDRGALVQAQIQLSPQLPPRVQSLTLALPPADGSPLARVLDAVIAWLNSGSVSWPESAPVADGVDAGLLARRLRMAATWTGPLARGAFRAGDGESKVTVELSGEHAPGLLSLSADAATGVLHAADVTL
jgi:CubicO group peptidase (beta-lactamase class C family)